MANDITHISNEVQDALIRFIDNHPAARVRKNLRKILMESLLKDGLAEDTDFQDIIYHLDVFELLHAIEKRRAQLSGGDIR